MRSTPKISRKATFALALRTSPRGFSGYSLGSCLAGIAHYMLDRRLC